MLLGAFKQGRSVLDRRLSPGEFYHISEKKFKILSHVWTTNSTDTSIPACTLYIRRRFPYPTSTNHDQAFCHRADMSRIGALSSRIGALTFDLLACQDLLNN